MFGAWSTEYSSNMRWINEGLCACGLGLIRNTFGQAIDQMRRHLAKRCAFGQIPRVLSITQMRCAFGQNVQIDQLRLTKDSRTPII